MTWRIEYWHEGAWHPSSYTGLTLADADWRLRDMERFHQCPVRMVLDGSGSLRARAQKQWEREARERERLAAERGSDLSRGRED